jgi:NAD(P)-dependent dehydrogenase (short-subunit alcohol dehydrogenase family)
MRAAKHLADDIGIHAWPQYGYRMSKAAVNMLGKTLAVDLKAKGIAVRPSPCFEAYSSLLPSQAYDATSMPPLHARKRTQEVSH